MPNSVGAEDSEFARTGKGGQVMAGYAGKIKNSGTQVVKAPHQSTDAKKGTVKKGGDLRSGRK